MQGKYHEYQVRVHYQDTDQMGVAHHANYISWFEIGRTEMMRDAGITYREMEDLGLLLPVLDLKIKYHKPARYDDIIIIRTKINSFSSIRLEFTYELIGMDDKQLLASGTTIHMWINDKWKPTRINKIATEAYNLIKQIASESE